MIKLLVVLGALLLSGTAWAQPAQPAPAQPGNNICVYRDKTFSSGAIICAGASLGIECAQGTNGGTWKVAKEAAPACKAAIPTDLK
jgi:hypothetical protein